jgi:hypothetical protein
LHKKVDLLPFAMLFVDDVSNKDTGYTDFDAECPYDTENQISTR